MKFMLLLFLELGSLLTLGAAEPKPIEAKVGQQFKVSLQSNPTTGYQWKWAQAPDKKLLKLLGHEYKRPGSKLMGAGGNEVWTFKALAEGRATLELNYVRPWETNSPPAQSTNFAVVIMSPKAPAAGGP